MLQTNQLLRFTTAGSVDDGKSTLIGRLLYDSKSIFEDQLDAVLKTSKRRGKAEVDLALFTDGLRDERKQGITIDVAYRYFTTPKRKFIIADTPGHVQYTRNMVTGASLANAAIILIDARKGVIEQTRRHTYIASLLGIGHILVCVNKMDLVDFQESVFNEVVDEFEAMSSKMLIRDVQYIPISALLGDNVVERSSNMDWYDGSPLLHTLETLHLSSDINKINTRFPVQTIIRPNTDFRGYAGRLASGILRLGDEIVALPSGFQSRIKEIWGPTGKLEEAFAPMSITLTLDEELDISRGDLIARVNNQPQCVQEFDAMLCWLGNQTAKPGTKYDILHTTNMQKALIHKMIYKFDVQKLERNQSDLSLNMNDIARVQMRTTRPLMTDSFQENHQTGSFVLVENASNNTVAAGLVL
ncbi:MAG: GTP-binding protein [Flavobacteriales bacterium]|nr:GTP-binding protein [Flavobacteriales bacterium]